MIRISFLLSLTCAAQLAFADSPLTSTFFATAYSDVATIAEVLKKQEHPETSTFLLEAKTLAFLDDTRISWDQKLALINAYGFGNPSNTAVYQEHLMRKYGLQMPTLDSLFMGSIESLNAIETTGLPFTARHMTDSDLLCLVYLRVMGDYFNPIAAINTIDVLYVRQPTSQAVALVGGLIAGQFLMDYDWCAVSHCTDVLYEKVYEKDVLRPEALEIVQAYIRLYADACLEQELAAETMDLDADGRVFNLEEYRMNPVYAVPTQRQIKTKSTYVDLVMVTQHSKKEMALGSWLFYHEPTGGTEWNIEVKNAGNVASIETNLMVRILSDPDADATPEGFFQQPLPALGPGETKKIQIVLPGYWMYDPNAHFTIELDFDNNIDEKEESNNSVTVFEWG